MRIYTLMENTAGNLSCIAEHGLSLYIETKKHNLLLDAGQTNAFLKNAKVLNVDLKQVDTLILSHGHYDHSGGILGFAKENRDADIYFQKSASRAYYSMNSTGERYIGIDPKILSLSKVHLLEGDKRIDEELFLYTGVTGRRGFSLSNLRLKEKTADGCIQDSFCHEQYLVIEQDEKKYLFSGCAHNGILNILDRFRTIYKCDPDAVISGFHYMKKDDYTDQEIKIITDTAYELKECKTIFYTCHCTGRKAYELMKPIMGEKLHMVNCGDIIEL